MGPAQGAAFRELYTMEGDRVKLSLYRKISRSAAWQLFVRCTYTFVVGEQRYRAVRENVNHPTLVKIPAKAVDDGSGAGP